VATEDDRARSLAIETTSGLANTPFPISAERKSKAAKDILGKPEYRAFSYGGFRKGTRKEEPSVEELKEDVRILSAMGVKIVRTYNTQQFQHAANLLEAIRQVTNENPKVEMYVMLGAWIDCQGAWSEDRNHELGSEANNKREIDAAVRLANTYPDVVKVIAVGNEAMVHWATQYFVSPKVILKWVEHLQGLKSSGELPNEIWITSSDNYESWGGGLPEYRTDDLARLIKAVDYVSLHTYPFHETHYQPELWGVPANEASLSVLQRADAAVMRSKALAIEQYQGAADYIKSLGIEKPIHIGETGWASVSGATYGANGSQAADEYKSRRYYEAMREWTDSNRMSCFYFEAFDERWKDENRVSGSENHFGLITLEGKAKYALWDLVDAGRFAGLTRNGASITKTFDGDESQLKASILPVPLLSEMPSLTLATTNEKRNPGQPVSESKYVVVHDSLRPGESEGQNDMTYPSAEVKINIWEGTCNMEMSKDGIVRVSTGILADGWWGCGLQIQSDDGENLSEFKEGRLHFEIKGDTASSFNVGFQSGNYLAGNQSNNFVTFGSGKPMQLTKDWTPHSIDVSELNKGANLADVSSVFYLHGQRGGDGKSISIKNIYYSK